MPLVVENGVTAKEPKRSFHSGKCNTLLLINNVFWPNFYFYLFLVILLFPLQFQTQLFVYRFANHMPLVFLPYLLGFCNSYSTKHGSPTFQNLEYCVIVVNKMTNMWTSFVLQRNKSIICLNVLR